MSDKIVANVDPLKELNSRAQGEVSIRDALTELEVCNTTNFRIWSLINLIVTINVV